MNYNRPRESVLNQQKAKLQHLGLVLKQKKAQLEQPKSMCLSIRGAPIIPWSSFCQLERRPSHPCLRLGLPADICLLRLMWQGVHNLIQRIANKFNGTDRDRYVQATDTSQSHPALGVLSVAAGKTKRSRNIRREKIITCYIRRCIASQRALPLSTTGTKTKTNLTHGQREGRGDHLGLRDHLVQSVRLALPLADACAGTG